MSKIIEYGKVTFNDSWLEDERFKTWLNKSKDKHKAICILCNNASIDITKMEAGALISHAGGAKHKERLKTYNPLPSLFFTRETNIKQNTPKSSEKIDSMLTAVSVSHAEIRWVLKVLTSHLSYRSCLNLNSLFTTMFPDSLIAKSFKLSKQNVLTMLSMACSTFQRTVSSKY